MIYTHKKQKTRPGSLFKWEAWRILLLQTYEQSLMNTDFLARGTTQKWISLAYSYLIMLNQALKSYITSQTKWVSR
jgi:hypothetical protein